MRDTGEISVLQVFNQYLLPGGEARSVENIGNHLAQLYCHSRCFFDSADWVVEGRPAKWLQALAVFYNPRSARILSEKIRVVRPQAILLHNPYPVGSPSLYRTAQREGVPILQYIHNFRPFSVGGTLWAKGQLCEGSLRQKFMEEVRLGAWQHSVIKTAILACSLKWFHRSGWLDAVHGWIAISEFMRSKFIEAGIDPSKIHTLRHPRKPDTRRDEFFGDQGYYLFLGRLVEEKGVRVLLETWSKLERTMGKACPKLVIAGDGDLIGEVQIAAGGSDHIEYVGFVSDLRKADYLKGCRALVAPSVWWEPLALVTYEAYDYKKAIFAAASGGLKESVSDDVTGFLHEPGDAQQLAEQIVHFESSTARERLAMGQAGRAWLEKNADPEEWRDRFDSILRTVVN